MRHASRWMSIVVVALAADAWATEPCPLDANIEQVVSVELTAPDPEAVLVAGVTLVVDHPETKLGLVGESIAVPKGTISGAPADAVASANDLGTAVRLVVARAGPLPIGRPLLSLHFQRCQGAAPAAAREFTCVIVDAADPSTNKLREGIGCTVVVP